MQTARTLGYRIAEELRAELARQQRSRRWLATQTGIAHVTVARYVKGASAASVDDLDAMCRALGLSIPDLLVRVERNGGYDPKPVGDALDSGLCAIGDSDPEPADSVQMVRDGLRLRFAA